MSTHLHTSCSLLHISLHPLPPAPSFSFHLQQQQHPSAASGVRPVQIQTQPVHHLHRPPQLEPSILVMSCSSGICRQLLTVKKIIWPPVNIIQSDHCFADFFLLWDVLDFQFIFPVNLERELWKKRLSVAKTSAQRRHTEALITAAASIWMYCTLDSKTASLQWTQSEFHPARESVF